MRLETVNLFEVTIKVSFLGKGLIARNADEQAKNQRVTDAHQTVQGILGAGTLE
jgi:hypothetical protein